MKMIVRYVNEAWDKRWIEIREWIKEMVGRLRMREIEEGRKEL